MGKERYVRHREHEAVLDGMQQVDRDPNKARL